MTVEATQRLTGGGGFAIGHQQQFAIWFVDKVAPFFGKKEENLDNLKLPKFLSIFHDTVVASATLMLVFFGAILLVLGPDVMANKEVITTGTPFDLLSKTSICISFRQPLPSLSISSSSCKGCVCSYLS